MKDQKTRTWEEFKKEHFENNPDEIQEYLNVSKEQNKDSPETIREAIKTVNTLDIKDSKQ